MKVMSSKKRGFSIVAASMILLVAAQAATARAAASAHDPPVLKVLFLGDDGHHLPHVRLRELAPALIARGIQLVYTEDLVSLTLENLRRYDALMIYGNIDAIEPEQDRALYEYVSTGGGLV